jgi:tripartite-type tricarboxylate transporter receptor subunit TctC
VESGKQFGLEIQSSSPQQLAELLKADAEEWRGLVKETGFTADS